MHSFIVNKLFCTNNHVSLLITWTDMFLVTKNSHHGLFFQIQVLLFRRRKNNVLARYQFGNDHCVGQAEPECNVMTLMLQLHRIHSKSLTHIYSSSCRWHTKKRVSEKCWIARRARCTMAFFVLESLLEEWPCVFMLLYRVLLVAAEILMQRSTKCLWKLLNMI